MGKFATDTNVSPDKTLPEIMMVLRRYNATKTVYGMDADYVTIVFEMRGKRVRFLMQMPTEDDAKVKVNQSGATRFSHSAYDQRIRSMWRSLLLTIKAKLESVESGIEEFEDAFMAQLVLPDGRTMGEWAKPQIDAIYSEGKMPPLLMLGSGKHV